MFAFDGRDRDVAQRFPNWQIQSEHFTKRNSHIALAVAQTTATSPLVQRSTISGATNAFDNTNVFVCGCGAPARIVYPERFDARSIPVRPGTRDGYRDHFSLTMDDFQEIGNRKLLVEMTTFDVYTQLTVVCVYLLVGDNCLILLLK